MLVTLSGNEIPAKTSKGNLPNWYHYVQRGNDHETFCFDTDCLYDGGL